MAADHDRIDLSVRVDTDVSTAWALVSEPGWFINEGVLVDHEVSWDGDTATVTDRAHGRFQFRREVSDAPRYLADRGVQAGQEGTARLVEFWVIDEGSSVTLRVAESGFASMPVPHDEQIAQYEQNTTTWEQQLALAQQRLGA